MTGPSYSYHWQTAYRRHEMTPHTLDWAHQPRVYKTCPSAPPVPLPKGFLPTDTHLMDLLEKGRQPVSGSLHLDRLAQVLLLSCTLTAKAMHGGVPFFYRSVASAGALYPTELYVATHSVSGINDGLYHYAIDRHSLETLVTGPLSRHLENALGPGQGSPTAPLTFFLSVIFFRSAWKYRARAYRYLLLDSGHLAENLMLALQLLGLRNTLMVDFPDQSVNRLPGLDGTTEACLGLIQAHGDEKAPVEPFEEDIPGWPPPLPPVSPSRVAEREVPYPLMNQIHEAGFGCTSPATLQGNMLSRLGPEPITWTSLPEGESPSKMLSYPECVFRRRSSRNFVSRSLSRAHLQAFVKALSTDSKDQAAPETLCIGLLIHACEGIPEGLYLLERKKHRIGRFLSGDFAPQMAHICLDQAWLRHAALHVLFMSNLKMVDEHWGGRGYRHAMLEAGRLGQRIYLMASTLGLGCCGIGAFYDDEAAVLFRLNSNSSLLYVVSAGPVARLI